MVHTLEFALPQRRGIAGDDDQFCLAGPEGLERGLVPKSDCHKTHMVTFILYLWWCTGVGSN
jgi:hypothetical protein